MQFTPPSVESDTGMTNQGEGHFFSRDKSRPGTGAEASDRRRGLGQAQRPVTTTSPRLSPALESPEAAGREIMKILWMDAMLAIGSRRRTAFLPWLLVLLLTALCAAPGWAAVRQTAAGPVSVEKMAGDLDTPWGLHSCRAGRFSSQSETARLFHFDAKRRRIKVSGVPEVYAWGQGGLMDVAAARDFQKTREIFLTYSKRHARGGGGTALAVAALSAGQSKAREPARHSSRWRLPHEADGISAQGSWRRVTGRYISRWASGETPIRRRTSPYTTAR